MLTLPLLALLLLLYMKIGKERSWQVEGEDDVESIGLPAAGADVAAAADTAAASTLTAKARPQLRW